MLMSKIIHMENKDRKTLNVDVSTWRRLQELKLELNLRSIREVINFLVDSYERGKK